MNNLLSYCGLVDAKIRASDKDLPVTKDKMKRSMSVPYALYVIERLRERTNLHVIVMFVDISETFMIKILKILKSKLKSKFNLLKSEAVKDGTKVFLRLNPRKKGPVMLKNKVPFDC